MERRVPTWLSLSIAGLHVVALTVLEVRRPLRRSTSRKSSRDARNLAIAIAAAVPVAFVETPIALRVAACAASKRTGIVRRLPLPRAIESLIAIVLLDYTLYHWHALTHRVPLLWRFHVVHHLDRDLDATTALRFHFGEMLLSVPWRVAQIIAIGVTPFAYSLWQLLTTVSILFHHSNVRLSSGFERRLGLCIVTPRLHGIHHADLSLLASKNLSSGLSLWDRLHGTFEEDVPQDAITVGVPAYRGESDVRLLTVLALPFRRQRDAWDAS